MQNLISLKRQNKNLVSQLSCSILAKYELRYMQKRARRPLICKTIMRTSKSNYLILPIKQPQKVFNFAQRDLQR